MNQAIEKTIHYNQLYDLYGNLLTQKQQLYFTHYFQDDYSLAEIADLMMVSRNAVHDQIQKVIEHLDTYETNLQLLEKKQKRLQILSSLRNLELQEIQTYIEELERLE